MNILILYCAFAYGAEFIKLVNVITDEETFEMLGSKYSQYPFILLPYIISIILFIFAPITFTISIIYNIYKTVRDIWK